MAVLIAQANEFIYNMRKIIFFTLLLIGCTMSAGAQIFEGGLLAGFNGTQVEGDAYRGYHKPGLLAGAYVQTDFTVSVFGAMEIKYSQKGSRSKSLLNVLRNEETGEIVGPVDDQIQKYIMRLGYVELPFYMGFRTSEFISVIGGVSLGYLLSSAEYDDYGRFPAQDEVRFNKVDLQPFAGFQFNVSELLKLDIRMAYSVLPIRGESVQYFYWRTSQFNNVISMALYYRLDR